MPLFPPFLAYLPVTLWACLIFLLSHTPDLHTSSSFDFALRKAGHLAVYAFLGFLYLMAKKWQGLPPQKAPMLFLVALYAASDEFHQSFVPGRYPSLLDVILDTAGGWLGSYLFFFWHTIPAFLKTRKQSSS